VRSLLSYDRCVRIVVETSYPDAEEHEALHIETAAASRGLVAAWSLLGSAPAEAGATIQAMRAC
jgi:hypothetical protein